MRNIFKSTIPVFLLAACASPSIQYAGVEGIPVDVDGSRFTVFRKGEDVQVIRTSHEVLPKKSEVFAKANVAINQTTGCQVRKDSLGGDQAVIEAKLDC